MTHYRYIREYPLMEDMGQKRIELIEFETVKETDCGYWIREKSGNAYSKKRFVLRLGRKKFAYPTKKEAFNSFVIRTKKSLGYAKRDMCNALDFIDLINKFNIDDSKADVRTLN